jgi:nucleotide-binding universal stress UspA family protein
MDYRTLLVHVGPDAASPARARLAADLAARLDAALTGMTAEAPDPWVDVATPYLDAGELKALKLETEGRVQHAERAFRLATSGLAQPVVWRSETALPAQALAAAGCAADLIVVGPAGDAALIPEILPRPGDVIMAAGLPVLLAPSNCERLVAETVLIAWKNTREARRAVADALPFLKQARRVLIVAVAEETALDTEAELTALGDRLGRHGVKAEPRLLSTGQGPAQDQLAALARRETADLVVAGAYGHSRLREWAFGGVTQHLLARPETCILFSR